MIPGAGGYSCRAVGLDTRYKTGAQAMGEIKAAYADQISRGYPFFVLFDDEARRLPFPRMYASDKSPENLAFESGINDYRFSRKFDFMEAF